MKELYMLCVSVPHTHIKFFKNIRYLQKYKIHSDKGNFIFFRKHYDYNHDTDEFLFDKSYTSCILLLQRILGQVKTLKRIV